jgi:hypothetical protein
MRLIPALVAVIWNASWAADESVTAPASDVSTEAAPPISNPAGKPAAPHAQHPAHRSPEQVLDERVAALGKALGLDAGQKAEVRKILMVQQSQLRQVWSDPAQTSADRIGVSNSINKQTEDRIRSILTEAQREQYIASKSAGPAGGHPEHGLDYWMGQMQGQR